MQAPSKRVAEKSEMVIEKREKCAKIQVVPNEKKEAVKKAKKHSKAATSEHKELPLQLSVPSSTHISEVFPSTIEHDFQIQRPSSIAPASPKCESTNVCELLVSEQQYYQLQQLKIEPLRQQLQQQQQMEQQQIQQQQQIDRMQLDQAIQNLNHQLMVRNLHHH